MDQDYSEQEFHKLSFFLWKFEEKILLTGHDFRKLCDDPPSSICLAGYYSLVDMYFPPCMLRFLYCNKNCGKICFMSSSVRHSWFLGGESRVIVYESFFSFGARNFSFSREIGFMNFRKAYNLQKWFLKPDRSYIRLFSSYL